MSFTEKNEIKTPLEPSDAAKVLSDEEHTKYLFPVVGIGASAGGLEAIRQLLSHLPENPGMAFVVVQHLDPTHESRLTDLLSKTTAMNVVEATQGLKVEPNNVYVIAPNTNITINDSVLELSVRSERGLNLPVDRFL